MVFQLKVVNRCNSVKINHTKQNIKPLDNSCPSFSSYSRLLKLASFNFDSFFFDITHWQQYFKLLFTQTIILAQIFIFCALADNFRLVVFLFLEDETQYNFLVLKIFYKREQFILFYCFYIFWQTSMNPCCVQSHYEFPFYFKDCKKISLNSLK